MITVFFDFETGGVQDHHPNIQLAAIAVRDESGEELGSFEQKICFNEAEAQPEALKLNGYDPEVWKREARPSDEVARAFSAWLKPFTCVERTGRSGPYYVARLAGHNAATFDMPRLRRMFEESRLFLPCEFFVRDTLQRALWYFDEGGVQPKSLKLTELCQHFQIPTDGAHDALTDVRLCIALSRALRGVRVPA